MAQRKVLDTLLLATLFLGVARGALPPKFPGSTDFVDDVIARRLGIAERARADLEEELDRAAKVAAELAKQKPWPFPFVPPGGLNGGPEVFVDLNNTGTIPKELNLEAAGASYQRFPTAVTFVPGPMITECLESRSVKRKGAKGNGTTDDTAAFLAANSDSKFPYIYLPPGQYKIARSITISKTIVAGASAQLNVASGMTLTLTKRPHKWDVNSALFKGHVHLNGTADTIHPSWFKNLDSTETDGDALQQAVDSCIAPLGCNIIITKPMWLNKVVSLRPNIGVISTSKGLLFGNQPGSTGEGIVLLPGKYTRPLIFAHFWGFGGFALKIRGGVTGVEMQINGLIDGGDGIVYAPSEGSTRTISNAHVTHLSSSHSIQNTVVFQATNSAHKLHNCLVRGNFLVSGGFKFQDRQSAGLAIKGSAPPALFATSVQFQAVEGSQTSTSPSKFAMLQNTISDRIADNVVFHVAAWGGGLWGEGRIISGKFSNLKLLARMSGGLPSSDQFMTINSDGTMNNTVSLLSVSSAGWEYKMGSIPLLKAFNGGGISFEQVFYVNVPVVGLWKSQEERTFFFYNVYAKTASQRFSCIPFRAGNAGLVCSAFENQNSKSEGQVAITIKNTAAYDLPDWQTTHRFGIQVGP